MYRVTIVRKDSVTPVTYENVKHAWWQADRLTLATGEHGQARMYFWWPVSQIDHVRIEELIAHP